MEKLANSAFLYVDVTTTEVCDHLLGGVLSAGADRLSAIARTHVPYVGSVGAVDMVITIGPSTRCRRSTRDAISIATTRR